MSDARVEPLANAVRHYSWGSRTVLPLLLGEPAPADEPWAEIWMGAHPLDPSYLPDGRSLADVVPGLPFMVKLLAAQEPLSVQAHPDLDQARAGFAAEQARGVPLSAPERSYKDANHKPELLVAIEVTEALCGFRSPASIRTLAAELGSAAWSALVARACPEEAADGEALRAVFTATLAVPLRERAALLAEVVGAAVPATMGPDESLRDSARWVRALADLYPTDPGVLAPLLLELVTLAPGDGLFVGAGVLHSYLVGAGVEVQASSDNVLRGGLTGKHVDVPELLRTVRFEPASGQPIGPRPVAPGLDVYDVPVADFTVWRARPDGSVPVPVPGAGPCIAVCVQGVVQVSGLRLAPGAAAYVPAVVPLVVAGAGTCLVTSTSPDLSDPG
jgi:mannose-6-phosphate isomerase